MTEAAETLRCGDRQVKQLKRQFDRTDLRWVLHRAPSTSMRSSTTRTMQEAGAGFNHVHWPSRINFAQVDARIAPALPL